MTKKEAYFTDDGEIEGLIQKHLGIEYEIVPAEECGNGQRLQYSFIKKLLDTYDQEDYDNMKRGNYMPYRTRTLMQVLVNEGHLEPGTYIIDCSW